jgi:hypothetical protein
VPVGYEQTENAIKPLRAKTGSLEDYVASVGPTHKEFGRDEKTLARPLNGLVRYTLTRISRYPGSATCERCHP